jgi:hypothetical protein
MSLDTGCIVMTRNGRVVGSLSREQSLSLAQSVIDWTQSVDQAVSDQIPKPHLAIVHTEP